LGGLEGLRADVLAADGCKDPRYGTQLADYCFGRGVDNGCAEIELHLLQCDACWLEIQRLQNSVQVLRTHSPLRRQLLTPGIVGVLGLSGRFDRPLAGHAVHVLVMSLLYAALFSLSLVFEVAYEFDRFGRGAVWTAASMFPVVTTLGLLGAVADWKLTPKNSARGLWTSVACVFLSAAAAVAGGLLVLPNRPITLMRIAAHPAPAAFLKDVIYYLALWILFVVIPYHAVISLQREALAGRRNNVLNCLWGEKKAIPPRGCILLRPWQLGLLLSLAVPTSFYLTAHLLDNLRPAPYMTLFVSLIQLRTLTYFSLGLTSLLWYVHTLNELKRECVAGLALQPHQAP
jgi:hypothetical protein